MAYCKLKAAPRKNPRLPPLLAPHYTTQTWCKMSSDRHLKDEFAMRVLEDMLALSPWTHHLPADHLDRVRSDIVVREFTSGAYVCRKGDPANAWLGVVDGLIKLHSISPAGKSVTFAGIPAGGWFGEGSVLKGEPLKYDIVALRASRIALMPEATFRWLLDTSIAFNQFLLCLLYTSPSPRD